MLNYLFIPLSGASGTWGDEVYYDTILDCMDKIREHIINDKLSFLGSIAVILCGVFCALMLLKISNEYLEGKGITFWAIVRPLVILACVSNFNGFVLKPVHSVGQFITVSINKKVNVSSDRFVKIMRVNVYRSCPYLYNSYIDMYENQGYDRKAVEELNALTMERFGKMVQDLTEDELIDLQSDSDALALVNKLVNSKKDMNAWDYLWGFLKSAGSFIGMAFSNFFDMLGTGILNLITTILFFIIKFYLMLIQMSCFVYLIILGLLGPFSFTFGVLPNFRNSINLWFERYIQTFLWIPVSSIMMLISLEILNKTGDFLDTYGLGGKYVMLGAAIISLWNLKAVPRIASWIIEGNGSSDVFDNVKGGAKGAAMAAGRAMRAVITKGK